MVVTVSLEAIADDLERFIRETFHVTSDDDEFSRQVHLFETGYVDSVGVLETIVHIEKTRGLSIPPTAIFDPLFTHIDGMAEYVLILKQTEL